MSRKYRRLKKARAKAAGKNFSKRYSARANRGASGLGVKVCRLAVPVKLHDRNVGKV